MTTKQLFKDMHEDLRAKCCKVVDASNDKKYDMVMEIVRLADLLEAEQNANNAESVAVLTEVFERHAKEVDDEFIDEIIAALSTAPEREKYGVDLADALNEIKNLKHDLDRQMDIAKAELQPANHSALADELDGIIDKVVGQDAITSSEEQDLHKISKTLRQQPFDVLKATVCGVGVNNVKGKSQQDIFYKTWKSMIERCYEPNQNEKRPSYVGCSVCGEWLILSNFKLWMQRQDWKGKHLDKDIIKAGNKMYSPEKCVFVTRETNNLLTDSASARGDFPLGVCKATSGRFESRSKINGKRVQLGTFDTPEEASNVYLEFKSNLIDTIANEQSDFRVADGLRRHAALLRDKIAEPERPFQNHGGKGYD